MIKNITNIWRNPKERQAYAYILSLAIPMVIQNLFTAAVSSADVLMLNSVGQSAISAAVKRFWITIGIARLRM